LGPRFRSEDNPTSDAPLARDLRHAVGEGAKDLVRKAAQEVRDHPVASAAVTLTVAAALISVLSSGRRKVA